MIDIGNLKQKHVGRGVVYRDRPGGKPQQGIITSFNDKFIFVGFGTRTMGRGEACRPMSLKWLAK